MSKELKYRAVCPYCNKAFDTRKEGFLYLGVLICADCHNNMVVLPKDKLVVMQGVDGLVVVDTDDVLMICRKGDEHNIRKFLNDAKMKIGDKMA